MLNKLYIAMYLCLFLIYSTVIAYIVCDKMIMFSRPTCFRRPLGSGNQDRRLDAYFFFQVWGCLTKLCGARTSNLTPWSQPSTAPQPY